MDIDIHFKWKDSLSCYNCHVYWKYYAQYRYRTTSIMHLTQNFAGYCTLNNTLILRKERWNIYHLGCRSGDTGLIKIVRGVIVKDERFQVLHPGHRKERGIKCPKYQHERFQVLHPRHRKERVIKCPKYQHGHFPCGLRHMTWVEE